MNLDLKQLVEAITSEVVSKIENSAQTSTVREVCPVSSSSPLLVVLGEGEEAFEEAFNSVKTLMSQGLNCAWAISEGAMDKFGPDGMRRITSDVKIVKKDVTREIYNILRNTPVVVVPVLTMADAFKISSLIGDSFVSKLVLQALFMGKKVIAAPDGIFLSLSQSSEQTSSSNSAMNSRLRGRFDQLRQLGIELVSLKNFREHLSQFISAGTSSCDGGGTFVCSFSEGGACGGCGLCVQGIPQNVDAIIEAGASRVGASLGIKGSVNSQVAGMIDHTMLKPEVTRDQIVKLCEEARKYEFASVCINPSFVSLARDLLAGSPVKVCTVIGFPLGADTSVTKAMETRDAIANGADEVDMVINVGALKAGDYNLVRDDIKAVVESAGGRIVKVIFETALLNEEEKIKACQLSKEAGADYVKTSTGFGPGGATVEDIALMRREVGKYMGVKASGGIRDYEKARAMIEAGATRIGASASVAIVEGKKQDGDGY